MERAWKRVKANKGAIGIDDLGIAQTAEDLQLACPELRQQLLEGSGRLQPVRRVGIPKPYESEREMGIPTVTDRLIQQALLQTLQPLIDPTFSDHSYRFRPGRRAHDAILAEQRYALQGCHILVDVDLSKFFDRVNHDILTDRLQKCVNYTAVIRLVRAYLTAGIMDAGSSLNATRARRKAVLCRHCWLMSCYMKRIGSWRNIGVTASPTMPMAATSTCVVRKPVMRLLRRCYVKLRLTIKESKSAVASAFGRKFFGCALWQTRDGDVRRALSEKAL